MKITTGFDQHSMEIDTDGDHDGINLVIKSTYADIKKVPNGNKGEMMDEITVKYNIDKSELKVILVALNQIIDGDE
jgi:hypothetical protein